MSSCSTLGFSFIFIGGLHGTQNKKLGRRQWLLSFLTRFIVYFATGAIAWHRRKQAIVALSSTWVKYIIVTLTTKKELWLYSRIQELGILQISKVKLWCANQSCVKIMKNRTISDQNKHIRAQCHFMMELVKEHNLDVDYTPTQYMWANFWMKLVSIMKLGIVASILGRVSFTYQ